MAHRTRDEYWDERLANWGVWMATDGNQGRSTISSIYKLYRGRYGDASGDGGVTNGDAIDLHSLIREYLTQIHYQAIVAWYALPGIQEAKARDLGIHVNTLRERVKAAKDNLERGDYERRRMAHRMKAAGS